MRLSTFAFGVSLVLISTAASAAVTNYKVHLVEAPNWKSDAGADVGDGTFTYDDATKKLVGSVDHTLKNAFNAQLYIHDEDAGDFGGKDKVIKAFNDPASPIGVAVVLKDTQATALTGGTVHFEIKGGAQTADGILVPDNGTTPADDAGADASTDTDGSTDPGPTDPGPTDPGTTDPGTTDPGSADSGSGGPTTTPSDGSGSEDEDDGSSGGDKGGCSVLRAGEGSSATFGAGALAGLLGFAFLARRRRKS